MHPAHITISSTPPKPLRSSRTAQMKTDLYKDTPRPRQQTRQGIQKSGPSFRHKLRRNHRVHLRGLSQSRPSTYRVPSSPPIPSSFLSANLALACRVTTEAPQDLLSVPFIRSSSGIPYALDVAHYASLPLLLASASSGACACSPPRTRPAVGRIVYC